MPIERDIFRKYIAYARQRIRPQLTTEAVEKMKEFYVNLRNRPMLEGQEMRTIPISARQLNSLVRMAEAASKLRMSETVDEKDAMVAIDLMKYYLEQAGMDEEGNIDMDKISGKMPSSKRNKIFSLKETLRGLKKEIGEQIPLEKIVEKLKGEMSEAEIEEALQKLKNANEIYEPRRGIFGLI